MKQVTKQEYFQRIASTRELSEIVGIWPYTHIQRESGREIGRIVGSLAPGTQHPEIKTYFLNGN